MAEIRIPCELVGGAQWKRALRLGGSDAIALWLAMLRHVVENETCGFVATSDLEDLANMPAKRTQKALEALLHCGVGMLSPKLQAGQEQGASRQSGLIEEAEGGYLVPQYGGE